MIVETQPSLSGNESAHDDGQLESRKRLRLSANNKPWDLDAAIAHERCSQSESLCAGFIQQLDRGTKEMLMGLFWNHYNPYLQLTRQQLFMDALDCGSFDFYCAHLHLAMLAIGLRFAAHQRIDVRSLILDGRESTLHQQVKRCLEILPLDTLRVPHAQALLLLSDLEYACGREATSRVYIRMLSVCISTKARLTYNV